MSCEPIRTWLGAYRDGELSPLRQWRLRLHLRQCSECARELRALDRLHELVLAADVVPTGGQALSGEGTAPIVTQRFMVVPRTAFAIAVALGLAAIAFMPSRKSYGDPLERAIDALMKAPAWRTSHVVIRSRDGKTVTEQWVALPHSLRWEVRRDGRLTEVTVQNEREAWIYRTERNVAVHSTERPYLPEPHGVGVVHGPLNSLRSLRRAAARIGGVRVTEQRVEDPEGRLLREFTVEVDAARHYPADPIGPDGPIRRDVLYLDAHTGRLVRWDDPVSGNRYTIDGYDQAFPAETFTWRVPSGVRVVEHADWWTERAGKNQAEAENVSTKVTVHAVDLAKGGDVWLTVSKRSEAGYDRLTSWPARGMLMEDERGRVYVHYQTTASANWPANVALLAFTPVRPQAPGSPSPRRVSVRLLPDHGAHATPVDHSRELVLVRGLRVPAASAWVFPPLSPLDLLQGEEARREFVSPLRERARRAYRADKPCAALG